MMKDINIRYIEENYFEFEEILKLTNLSVDKLNQLIAHKLIPEPSYIIDSEVKISSSLNDSYKMVSSKRYFAKNIIDLVRNNIEGNYENLKENLRRIFYQI